MDMDTDNSVGIAGAQGVGGGRKGHKEDKWKWKKYNKKEFSILSTK